MVAPDNRRTATLECIEEGNVLSITYEQVEELYYQNPTFGFYFLRLATARLFDNVNRMESELSQEGAAMPDSAAAPGAASARVGSARRSGRNFKSAALG